MATRAIQASVLLIIRLGSPPMNNSLLPNPLRRSAFGILLFLVMAGFDIVPDGPPIEAPEPSATAVHQGVGLTFTPTLLSVAAELELGAVQERLKQKVWPPEEAARLDQQIRDWTRGPSATGAYQGIAPTLEREPLWSTEAACSEAIARLGSPDFSNRSCEFEDTALAEELRAAHERLQLELWRREGNARLDQQMQDWAREPLEPLRPR